MKNTVNKLRGSRSFVLLCALVVLGTAGVVARTGAARLLPVRAVEMGRPEIKVALAATVARNDSQLALKDAGAVRPGEILTWTITSENAGQAAAHDYNTIGQIPKGTSFVAGSANSVAGTVVTYSIDNGKTYTAQPMIAERQPDGTMKQVPAPAAMYTQVRYEWADPLAADAKLAATYKVRVR